MKYILGFLFLFGTQLNHAQVVVDDLKHPVAYVDVVVLGNSTTFWQTDINGKIPSNALKGLDDKDTLVFHHIAFKEMRTSAAEIASRDTIFLVPNSYNLKEIALTSKTPKYQKMKACFRSLVVQDNRPLYYSDGKVDYLTETKNIKYELFRYAYRSFEHKQLAKFDVSH